MSKLVLVLSMISLAVLLAVGLAAPDSPVVWMASTVDEFMWLRGALIIILLGLLITNPPRNIYFRLFVGVVSVGLAGWSLHMTYINEMKFLDTMSILQFSISAGLIVLERDYEAALAEAMEAAPKRKTAKLATA